LLLELSTWPFGHFFDLSILKITFAIVAIGYPTATPNIRHCRLYLASAVLRNLLEITPRHFRTRDFSFSLLKQTKAIFAMAEIPPEQVHSQYRGTGHIFDQKTAAASAGSSKQPRDDDSKAPLPKGVVLDKDGKP
jgi:hypothetical protein